MKGVESKYYGFNKGLGFLYTISNSIDKFRKEHILIIFDLKGKVKIEFLITNINISPDTISDLKESWRLEEHEVNEFIEGLDDCNLVMFDCLDGVRNSIIDSKGRRIPFESVVSHLISRNLIVSVCDQLRFKNSSLLKLFEIFQEIKIEKDGK